MKLQSIAVRNFRGIGPGDGLRFPDQDVPLVHIDMDADQIFIVGPNNAGKSTLLRAYEFFSEAKKQSVEDDFHGADTTHQILIEAKIRATAEELADDQTRRWFQNQTATVRKVWNGPNEEGTKYCFDPETGDWNVGGFGGFDTILQSRLPEPIWIEGFADPANIIIQLQALIKEAVLENLTDKDEYRAAEEALASLRNIIEEDAYVDELSCEISSAVRQFFPDASLTITNPSSDKGIAPLFDKQAEVRVSAQGSPTLPFSKHGHGLQRQLVLSALQGAAAKLAHLRLTKAQRRNRVPDVTKPRILLIEEPELFLSPPSVRVMKKVLEQFSRLPNFQVMAATHSPQLVDLSAPKQTLVRISRNSSSSSYEQIGTEFFDIDERRTLRAATMFNRSASECVFAAAAIIVEGPSEISCLTTLAERFSVERGSNRLLESTIISFGGKTEIPLIQRILRHLKVPYIVVHDFDDRQKIETWDLNFAIGREVERCRNAGVQATRIALFRDFETSHCCAPQSEKFKALTAHQYALRVDLDESERAPLVMFAQLFSLSRERELHLSDEAILKIDLAMELTKAILR